MALDAGSEGMPIVTKNINIRYQIKSEDVGLVNREEKKKKDKKFHVNLYKFGKRFDTLDRMDGCFIP